MLSRPKSIKRSVSNDKNFAANKPKYNRIRQHKSQADLQTLFNPHKHASNSNFI